MKDYLGQSDETYLYEREFCIKKPEDVNLFVRLYHEAHVRLKQPMHGKGIRFGLKCPGTLYRHDIEFYKRYFPHTKLIIGIRHPISWFESFYNYQMWRNVSLPSTDKLIGRCVNHQKVCTDRARFHAALARLGMTSMESEEEKGLLFGLRYELDRRRSQRHRLLEEGGMRNNNATSHGLPNQIFLYETRQIHVTTASNELSSNIQQYLNIQHPLKEILSYSQSKTRAIDICHDNHTEVRKLLVEHSTDAADWIEQYFVKSTNVVVSAQDYFFGLLDDWRMDPCKGRQH